MYLLVAGCKLWEGEVDGGDGDILGGWVNKRNFSDECIFWAPKQLDTIYGFVEILAAKASGIKLTLTIHIGAFCLQPSTLSVRMIPVCWSTERSIVSMLTTCVHFELGYLCHMPITTWDHGCLKKTDERQPAPKGGCTYSYWKAWEKKCMAVYGNKVIVQKKMKEATNPVVCVRFLWFT